MLSTVVILITVKYLLYDLINLGGMRKVAQKINLEIIITKVSRIQMINHMCHP